MAVKVTLPNGKQMLFPDHWTDDQIRAHINNLETRAKTTDVGGALRRGFAQHAPDIIDLGAGVVGLAGDITDLFGERKFEETEEAIRDKADDARLALGGEAMQDVSDTFIEKVVGAAGGAPGMAASFLPTLAVPGGALGRLGTAALRFGVHGGLMGAGEGLPETLQAAAMGAGTGVAFGAAGKFAGSFPGAMTRRAVHGAGTGAAATGLGLVSGEPIEDALAQGLAFGGIAAASKTPYKPPQEIMKKQAEVGRLINDLKERPEYADKPLTEIAAEAAQMYAKTEAKARYGDIEANLPKRNKPFAEESQFINEMQNSAVRTIRTPGAETFLKDGLTEQHMAKIKQYHPVEYAKEMEAVKNMPNEQRMKYLERWGVGGKAMTEHELARVNIMQKLAMVETTDRFMQADMRHQNLVQQGAPKEAIKTAREARDAMVEEAVKTYADYQGFGSEMSRVFNMRKLEMKKSKIGERALAQAVKGDSPIPLDMVRRILRNPDDINAAHAVMRAAIKRTPSDYLYEVWINGLLSGPPTHAVNFLSNAATQVVLTAERMGTGALDSILSKIEGRERSAYVSDVFGDMYGAFQGIKAGLRDAREIFKDEKYNMEIAKKFEGGDKLWNIPGRTGAVIRYPSRMLRIGDAFFRSVGAQREGWAQAHKLGMDAVKRGEIKRNQVGEYSKKIMENPSEILLETMNAAGKAQTVTLEGKMAQYGEQSVFTNPMGKYGKAVQGIRRDIPGLRWVIPFVRTPANIMKFALKRTPLGLYPAMKNYARYLQGELPAGPVVADAAATLMGTAVSALVVLAAKEGLITGAGPSDWNERANKMKTGWRPYSFFNPLTNEFVPYSRVEPIATVFGLAADAVEIIDAGIAGDEDIADKIVAAAKGNITNKTFLTGIEQLVNAWGDPDMFAKSYARTLIGSAVPNLVAQAANVQDPYLREAALDDEKFGWMSPAARRIPFLTQQLPVKHTILGKPLTKGGRLMGEAPIYRGIDPIRKSKLDPEAIVEAEFAKLAMYGGTIPSMPTHGKRIRTGPGPYGMDVKLTEDEYAVYHKYHKIANAQLQAIIMSDGYQMLPPIEKAYMLNRIYQKHRQAARRHIDYMVRQRM